MTLWILLGNSGESGLEIIKAVVLFMFIYASQNRGVFNRWSELTQEQRNFKKYSLIIFGLILLIGQKYLGQKRG